ncbi:transposase [Streptomyces puniciscabiei]
MASAGTREIRGMRAGGSCEGAKYRLQVLTAIKDRGVDDVFMLVGGGLKGLPDSVSAVWLRTVTRNCVVHLVRASFRWAGHQDWGGRQRSPAHLSRSARLRQRARQNTSDAKQPRDS